MGKNRVIVKRAVLIALIISAIAVTGAIAYSYGSATAKDHQSEITSLAAAVPALKSSLLDPPSHQASDITLGFPEVVNTQVTVTNDLDGGDYGYWALDNFTAQIQIWLVGSSGQTSIPGQPPNGVAEPPFTYLVFVYVQGNEVTYYGATQPNGPSATSLEPATENGSIYGGVLFFGTANSAPTFPSSYSAMRPQQAKAVILEDTYSNQGSPNGFFTNLIYDQFTSNVGNDWVFTYTYASPPPNSQGHQGQNQFDHGQGQNEQVMVSSGYNTTGNIIAFPDHARMVMSISYNVVNDEDSGFVGYWALDNYSKTVTVWQESNGIYYAVAYYTGTWTTFAGALSPESGALEASGGTGSFSGGYVMTITGKLNSNLRLHGFIGTFNFGGTQKDILLGSYGKGQTGSTTAYDWVSAYFGSGAITTMPYWGWTYTYPGNSGPHSSNTQTWINSYYGSSGDIVL
jgi:hypothetical protein